MKSSFNYLFGGYLAWVLMVSFVLAPLGIIPFFLLYISFFISFVKSFYIIMYKIMKPDKAV